jgi:hypothetical protein
MMDDIEAEYDLPSAKPGRKLYPAFSPGALKEELMNIRHNVLNHMHCFN